MSRESTLFRSTRTMCSFLARAGALPAFSNTFPQAPFEIFSKHRSFSFKTSLEARIEFTLKEIDKSRIKKLCFLTP